MTRNNTTNLDKILEARDIVNDSVYHGIARTLGNHDQKYVGPQSKAYLAFLINYAATIAPDECILVIARRLKGVSTSSVMAEFDLSYPETQKMYETAHRFLVEALST